MSWIALVVSHTAPTVPVPRVTAVQHAFADPASGPLLGKLHVTRTDVTPIDKRYELLGFYDGPRLVATVGVVAPCTMSTTCLGSW